ncbi:uncharacterized protein LOC125945033 [Dermacentor silvarum]|uniref:uncharacterized protein LOC125945033 n=1 Tax=Dermacentor silvarum TaxID=543639 RepID=UPI0021018E20|nr:uncharacterized protein LOC125945033 [Dermacentor silvarum]
MAGSERAATAVVNGRGSPSFSMPKDYRIILPNVSSGEAMKRAVMLHCDISGRPYRIEDFRKPLQDAGVIKDVAVIGAYQMSHVWLVNLRTDEAKKKLIEAGRLVVKDRLCIVIDPNRQEVRLKLHWVALDVTSDNIRRAFSEYGEVKEVTNDRWKAEGFDCADSLTKFVRLFLNEGIALDNIPHQMRLGSGTVLIVAPGRAPLCLRCKHTGHIRRDCRVPKCPECHAFGHGQEACTRSYAKAVGRSTVVDQSELVMDEEEAEQAAAPATADKSGTDQGADKEVRVSGLQTPAMTVSSVGEHQETAATNAVGVGPVLQDEGSTGESSDATSVSQTQQAASIKPAVDESAVGNMDAETTPAKRRHDDVSAVSQEQRLRQVEASLEANGVTKKPRSAVRTRASSLTRGGKEVNSTSYGDCTKRRDGK